MSKKPEPDPLVNMTANERMLYEALEAASNHLDYCGYGDSWERECAESEGLSKKIADALETANGEKAKREAAEAQDLYLEPFRVHGEHWQTRIPLTKREKRKRARQREKAALDRVRRAEAEDADVPWYSWQGDGPW